MKKSLPALMLTAVLLSGCASSASLAERMQNNIDAVLAQNVSQAGHNKTYYSYYIEPSVGRFSGNETGNVFSYEGTKFLMNLNVPSIVNEQTYPDSDSDGIETISSPMLTKDGTYSDSEGVIHEYHLRIYQQNQVYLTLLNTDTVNFYSLSDAWKTVDLAAEMLKIARTVEVKTDAVLAAYTNSQKLDYKTEKIQLYNEIVPESGSITELINDTNTIGNTTGNDENSGTNQNSSDNQK